MKWIAGETRVRARSVSPAGYTVETLASPIDHCAAFGPDDSGYPMVCIGPARSSTDEAKADAVAHAKQGKA